MSHILLGLARQEGRNIGPDSRTETATTGQNRSPPCVPVAKKGPDKALKQKTMEAMVESLKALKPVSEGLYAVLTGPQKEKADTLLGGHCGMM